MSSRQNIKAIETHEDELDKKSAHREFICSAKDDQVKDILTCNEILEINKDQQDEDAVETMFKRIKAHEGPLLQNYPNHKGSRFNVIIKWENGEITSEPLSIIGANELHKG